MRNKDNNETATSVARRGGSGSFAAGGGDVRPLTADWVRDRLDPKLRQL
jgi:hypothetical protein